jgi:hypothetical protein
MSYELDVLIKELIRRKNIIERVSASKKVDELAFQKQKDYIADREHHRFRSMKCTRRAGKSSADVLENFLIADQFPESRLIYGALTLDSSIEIAWDMYLDFAEQFKINLKPRAGKYLIWPNGSKLRFFGLDSSQKEMRKILGQKLRKASIDEAGSITVDMKKVVYQMIMPALSDLRPNSWMTLLGTCENIPNTFFEKVTEGREVTVPWSRHEWTAYDNPHMVEQWTDEINDLKTTNPKIIEASWFRTHFLNEWCTDDDLRIIFFDDQNKVDKLPDGHEWSYILGVDIGYNDANAFTVVAFSYTSPNVYFIDNFKKAEIDLSGVAAIIKHIKTKYDIMKVIIDGANKQGIEEIKNRHGLQLQIAEKTDKATYLRLMKDDFVTKRAFLLDKETEPLQEEWEALQWVNDQKEKEDPRCQNHSSDSALYAWREARHFTYREEDKEPHRDTSDYMEKRAKEEAEQMRREAEERDEWNPMNW